MPYALANGIRLYYEEHGEGATILCIHGGGSTAMLWEDALPELAEQSDDAAGLLEALSAGPAIVIARSYG